MAVAFSPISDAITNVAPALLITGQSYSRCFALLSVSHLAVASPKSELHCTKIAFHHPTAAGVALCELVSCDRI